MAIEAARLSVVVDADTSAGERGLDQLGDRVNRSGGLVRDVAGTAFGFLSAQAALHAMSAAKSMFDLGTSTEEAMNVFQSVTRASGDVMADVSQLARDLGNDITLPGTSARDATLAMVELAKAGLSVDQTMNAAKGTLQLAAAASTDAATAATITANALNAFGLGGDQAVRVADLLAASANSSSGEITDMAYALQMSSAVFADSGQSIDDLTTSISLMANKGILGSDAGTSLKTMMLALNAPTAAAKTMMNSLGISIRDAEGNMLPMRDLVGTFTTKLSGLGDAQRDHAMKVIFGSDAIRAASIVLSGGVDAFDEMHTAVTRQGAAAEVAAARMKGVGGALEGLKSQIETLLIDGFNAAAPVMETVIRGLSSGMPVALAAAGSALTAVAGPIRAMVAAFRAGGDDITSSGIAGVFEQIGLTARAAVDTIRTHWGTISGVVSKVFELWLAQWKAYIAIAREAISTIVDIIGWLNRNRDVAAAIGITLAVAVAAWGAYTVATKAWALATKAATAVQVAWNAVMNANPVMIWIAALALAAGAIYLLYQRNETFRSAVQATWAWLQANVPPIARAIVDGAVAAFGFLRERVPPIVQAVADGIMAAFGWLRDNVPPIVQAVSDAVMVAFGWINENVVPVVTSFVDMVIAAMARARDIFESVWPIIATIVEAAWATISAVVTTGIGVVRTVIETGIGVIRALWGPAWLIISSVVESTWALITSVIEGALQVVKGIFDTFAGLFTGDWGRMWDGITGIVSGAWTMIEGAVSASIGLLVTLVTELPGKILGALGDLGRLLWDKGWDLINGLWNGIKDLFAALLLWVYTLPREILNAVGDLASLLLDVGKAIIQGLWDGMKDVWGQVTGWLGDVGGKIGGFLKDPLGIFSPSRVMHQQGRYIMQGLSNGLADGWAPVEGQTSKFGGEMIDILSGQLRNGAGSAAAACGIVGDSMSTAMGSAVDQLHQVILDGMVKLTDSIEEALDRLVTKVDGMVSKVWSGADSAKKAIGSIKDTANQDDSKPYVPYGNPGTWNGGKDTFDTGFNYSVVVNVDARGADDPRAVAAAVKSAEADQFQRVAAARQQFALALR